MTTNTATTPVRITGVLDNAGEDRGNALGRNLVALGMQVGGDYTDDSRPVLQGTAPAGATIAITDDRNRLGTVTADADGLWSFDLGPANFGLGLPNGLHTLQAWALTADGRYDTIDPLQSATELLYVDAVQPARAGQPQITGVFDDIGPVQGQVVSSTDTFVPVAIDDRQPTFTGTGKPGGSVRIDLSDGTQQQVGVTLAGDWTFTPNHPLSDGVTTIDVTDHENTDRLLVDIQAGAGLPPVITAVQDQAGTPLPDGTATTERQPTLQGTAEPGTDVEVYANGALIGHATTADDWSWSFTPTQALADAEAWQFAVVAVSGADRTPAPYVWTLSGSETARAPLPPVITRLTDNFGDAQGWLGEGLAVTDDLRPTLDGTAEPGMQVEILDQGVPIGMVTAGSDWTWSWTPDTDLAAGHHVFTATALDTALGTSSSSPYAYAADIASDPAAPLVPVITDVFYSYYLPPPRVPDGGAIDLSVITLHGTSEPGTRIEVFDNDRLAAAVLTNPDGTWIAPSFHTAPGTNVFTAQARWQMDGRETMSISPEYTIRAGTGDLSLLAPVITAIIDDTGPKQGPLSTGDYTDDHLLHLTGTAQPGSTVVLYDTPTKLGQTVADADGLWTFDTPPLPDGYVSLSAMAVSPDGLASAPSASHEDVGIRPIITMPNTPTITTLIDDVGPWQGTLTNPDSSPAHLVTDDPRPTLAGTSDAGTVVEVRMLLASVPTSLGLTTADANGAWRLTPEFDLPLNGYWTELEVIARSTTNLAAVASNRSSTGTAPSLTLIADQQQTAEPTLYSILDDVGDWQGPLPLDTGTVRTDDPHPTFTGTATPGATVYLDAYAIDTTSQPPGADQFLRLGNTVADDQGRWEITPEEALPTALLGPMDLEVTSLSPTGTMPPMQMINLHGLLFVGPDAETSIALDRLLADAGLAAADTPSDITDPAAPDAQTAQLQLSALQDAARHDLAY